MNTVLPDAIAKALDRYTRHLGHAWVTDCQEHVSDKRLKEAWAAADVARDNLIRELEKHDWAREVIELRKENTSLGQLLTEARQAIAVLEGKVERLRAALEPFAAGALDGANDKWIVGVTMGDLRRAQEALK